MSLKKWSVVLGVLVVVSMVLTACPAPHAAGRREGRDAGRREEVKVVQTQVVTQVQTQVVEKVRIEVVATPTALPKEALLRVNLGTYPDVIDPQKSSFVNEIAHLQLMYEGLTKLEREAGDGPRRG